MITWAPADSFLA